MTKHFYVEHRGKIHEVTHYRQWGRAMIEPITEEIWDKAHIKTDNLVDFFLFFIKNGTTVGWTDEIIASYWIEEW